MLFLHIAFRYYATFSPPRPLAVHPRPPSGHKLFHLRKGSRGSVPGSCHRQSTMGGPVVHTVLGRPPRQKTIDQAGGKGIAAAHPVEDLKVFPSGA